MKHSLYYVFIVALLGLASCAKTVDQVPVPSRGPSDMVGRLTFFDEFQKDSLTDLSGITGIAVTATNSAGGEFPGSFDAATNQYKIPNLAPGKYTLTFKADGFATIQQAEVDHIGGDVQQRPPSFIYRVSTTKVTALTLDTLTITTTLTSRKDSVFAANVTHTLTGLVIYHTTQPDGTVVDVTKNYASPKDTTSPTVFSANVSYQILLNTRNVRYKVTLDSASKPARPDFRTRGYVIYFSDKPSVAYNDYVYRAVSDPGLAGSSFTVAFPLQTMVNAGILRADNRQLYAIAYAISGDKNWYGAHRDGANAAVAIIPGMNLSDGAFQSANATLPVKP